MLALKTQSSDEMLFGVLLIVVVIAVIAAIIFLVSIVYALFMATWDTITGRHSKRSFEDALDERFDNFWKYAGVVIVIIFIAVCLFGYFYAVMS